MTHHSLITLGQSLVKLSKAGVKAPLRQVLSFISKGLVLNSLPLPTVYKHGFFNSKQQNQENFLQLSNQSQQQDNSPLSLSSSFTYNQPIDFKPIVFEEVQNSINELIHYDFHYLQDIVKNCSDPVCPLFPPNKLKNYYNGIHMPVYKCTKHHNFKPQSQKKNFYQGLTSREEDKIFVDRYAKQFQIGAATLPKKQSHITALKDALKLNYLQEIPKYKQHPTYNQKIDWGESLNNSFDEYC